MEGFPGLSLDAILRIAAAPIKALSHDALSLGCASAPNMQSMARSGFAAPSLSAIAARADEQALSVAFAVKSNGPNRRVFWTGAR
jgi:hypothetical protein